MLTGETETETDDRGEEEEEVCACVLMLSKPSRAGWRAGGGTGG